MAKQTAKASTTNRGRRKVEVEDLSKSEKKLSARQMKNVKGGKTTTSTMTIVKTIDKSSPK